MDHTGNAALREIARVGRPRSARTEEAESTPTIFHYFDIIRNTESTLAIQADRLAAIGNEAGLGILKLLLNAYPNGHAWEFFHVKADADESGFETDAKRAPTRC
jgi:hypothetical protein